MALVEEELPSVNKVKQQFQLREDSILARQLQEREYEEHFNANVQLRRTAMQDVKIAKQLQKQESLVSEDLDRRRRDVLLGQEEQDREAARRLYEQEQQEAIEQNRKDEEIASRLQREQDEHLSRVRAQEEADNRLAHQSVKRERQLRDKMMEDSEREARRLQQLELADPRHSSLPASLPPPDELISAPLPPSLGDVPVLPSYDALMFGTDGDEELDEITLQEQRDNELARQLQEKEAKKLAKLKRRQELADEELARKMQEQEESAKKKGTSHETDDLEMARRMQADVLRKMTEQEKKDFEMARKFESEKAELQRRASDQELADMEMAKKMQKEEIIARRRELRLRKEREELLRLRQVQNSPGSTGSPPKSTMSVPAGGVGVPTDPQSAAVMSSLPSSTTHGQAMPAKQSYRRQPTDKKSKKKK